MYPANITFPDAAALIVVPVGAAKSRPVCALERTLLLSPNLDVIFPPEIGLTATTTLLFVVVVLLLDSSAFLASSAFFASSSICATFTSIFSVFNFEIATVSSTVSIFSFSNICFTPILSASLSLYSSCKSATILSASSSVPTYVLISSSIVIPYAVYVVEIFSFIFSSTSSLFELWLLTNLGSYSVSTSKFLKATPSSSLSI